MRCGDPTAPIVVLTCLTAPTRRTATIAGAHDLSPHDDRRTRRPAGRAARDRLGRLVVPGSALRDRAVRAPLAGLRSPADQLLLDAVQAAGATLGRRATFVQLSSEVCTPCRRTAAVLSRLVDDASGVAHVELDAAQHPELVRTLRVLRTPTVIVLDGAGLERGRSSGAMTPTQALVALDVVPEVEAQRPARSETRRA